MKNLKNILSLSIILFLLVFTFCGCSELLLLGSGTLNIDGKTYKTGFYGTLFPQKFEFTDKTAEVYGLELRQLKHDKFDLYHSDVGSYDSGTLYCEESQYDKAVAYYSDPENYSYFCIIGVDSATTSAQTVEIDGVDTDFFDALLKFADNSMYEPFDSEHNAKIEKVDLPMPDHNKDTRFVFYKESKDSLFVSLKGAEYYIIDNSLYLAYQYDYGHGEYEKLIAVKVPEDISDYFVEFALTHLLG